MEAGILPSGDIISELLLLVAVSASHMSMPNHWLPFLLVGKAQSWTLRKILLITVIGAFIHVTSTISLVAIVSKISGALLSDESYRVLSSLLLLAFGLYYLHEYIFLKKRGSCCEPGSNSERTLTAKSKAVDRAAEVSLGLLMAFSPCVGSMPVLFAVLRPPLETLRILMAFFTLLGTSALVMAFLVAVAFKGANRIDFELLRKHEKLILGLCFVTLSMVTYFLLSHAHHHHNVHVVERNISSVTANLQPGQNLHHHDHHYHRQHHHP